MKTLLKYFIIISLFFGCREGVKPGNENTSLNQPQDQPTEVKVYQTQYSVFAYQIQSVRKIKAFKEQKLLAEINGLVDVCHIKNGQAVSHGALLLKFNSESIALKINKVRENVYNSKLNYQSDLLSQESLLQNKK